MKRIVIGIVTTCMLTSCGTDQLRESTKKDGYSSQAIIQQQKNTLFISESLRGQIQRMVEDIRMWHPETSNAETEQAFMKSNVGDSQAEKHKNVAFDTFYLNKKRNYGEAGYVELILNLPKVEGNYEGIAAINEFFMDKEVFYYNELPMVDQAYFEEIGKIISGKGSGYYRSASYKLEAVIGDIISVSADLDGGAGGVGWAGIEGETFNLNTGEKLNMGDLFKIEEHEYKQFIYSYVSEEIKTIMDERIKNGSGSGYNFNDVYSDKGHEAIHSYDFEDFYLKQNALVVFYPKYALSCGAAGPQIFEIPFDEISDILIDL